MVERDRSVWVLNEYGSPIGYRLPNGEIVRIMNAAYLVLWYKRRLRAAARGREEKDDGTNVA